MDTYGKPKKEIYFDSFQNNAILGLSQLRILFKWPQMAYLPYLIPDKLIFAKNVSFP